MSQTVLNRLLDDNFRFDVANRGTVNHLPMALLALSRLGATDQRLTGYFGWWEENRALPRRDSGRPVGRAEWRRCLGEADMFDALSTMFRDWVAERGAGEVVGEVFPVAAAGVAAAAFHGLIRLAYGLDAGHAGEIGAGLATLCSRYAPLGVDAERAPTSPSVATSLNAIATALDGAVFTGAGIIGRMQAASADPRFAAAFSTPPIGATLLTELARAGIALYWQTGDFTVLHMVTATHAARLLLEQHRQLGTGDAIRNLWVAASAAYASAGAPRLTDPAAPPQELPSWPAIFAQAIQSNDDHVIKMTYTCHCENTRYGNPLYQSAAARLAAIGKA